VLEVKTPFAGASLAAEDHGAGVICPEVVGSRAGLEVARRNILDQGSGRVRYAVAGTRPAGRTANDVTALVFSLRDAPGALLDALQQFAERGVNLTKIQSRPMPGQEWAYLFFAEVAGHFTDRPLVAVFEELKRSTRFFKVLGSYPTP
jgi:chorismate mutase/prephenate dehydratase